MRVLLHLLCIAVVHRGGMQQWTQSNMCKLLMKPRHWLKLLLLAAGWEAGTAFGSAANINFHEPICQRMVYYCRWHWRWCHESSEHVAAQSAHTKAMIEINDRESCHVHFKLE